MIGKGSARPPDESPSEKPMKSPSARTLLCLTLFYGGALANENWLYLGDYYARPIRAMGAFSLNLDTLRRREHHFEVWERLSPLAESHALPGVVAPAQQERLTLWAIRCRSGIMAKITEGVAGSFEPRAESLRFFLPAPGSSGAAMIEATCAEVRRAPRKNQPTPVESARADAEPHRLDLPPEISQDEALENEEE